jgi:hypothetical protein
LLITFLDRNSSSDVLEVMSNLLGFSADERVKVGTFQRKKSTASGSAGGGGLLSWFSGGSSVEKPDTPAPTSISKDGSTLSDAWVDFLLKELNEDGTSAHRGKSSKTAPPVVEKEIQRISIGAPTKK